jgi:hypothetical protein
MANITLRLSTGSAATTNSNPNLSLGGQMATNAEALITTSNTSLNNLWDDITKAENFNGTVNYRCVYIHNDTVAIGELFADGEVFINGVPFATFELGVGTKNVAAPIIVDEESAPGGISFSSPTDLAPLLLMAVSNVLDPNDFIPLWIKRTAANIAGSGTVTDTLNLRVRGTE